MDVNGTCHLINLILISEGGEATPNMQGKYVNTHTGSSVLFCT